MRNLSLKGLETEASVRNHNLIKNAFFTPQMGVWDLNGGSVTPEVLSIANVDVTVYTTSYPYSLTLPLFALGGVPGPLGYTWGLVTHTPGSGTIDLPSKTISGNTLLGTFASNSTAQVLIRVQDSRGIFVSKVINITCVQSTTAP